MSALAERLEAARAVVEALFPGALPADQTPPLFFLPHVDALAARFADLQRRLMPLGFLALLRRRDGRPALLLLPRPPRGRWAWQVNLVLLLATVATTFVAGYLQSQALVRAGYLDAPVVGGVLFSASVMFILGAHEMGHKLVALRRGIDASLPYFLPMLPPVGTMGAVIVTRTPAPNRDSLMDLGASGPIAGFLAAIPVLLYGISRSFVVTPTGLEGFEAIPDPLLIRWLVDWLLPRPSDAVVLGHPVLFAGWLGLVVTSINLLPAGMLDGGHAVRALFGPRVHQAVSYAGAALAALMGFLPMALLILLLMRRGHAGPLDDVTPVSPLRWLVGLALLVIFLVSAVRLPLGL
ncbi:MAG: site-2 protease family protein [Armatimonadota bacterium]|nr:site-2 protease family protein [Armatimonadota bacterium]MDR7534345.1 site-2 protease family protein [Armatimonadota bacterium]MDR7536019.1 site-2 protease family protein [Armatimonadota bacterium]